MLFADAREFLSRAVPWTPGAHVNLHWQFQAKGYDRPAWGGRACLTLDEAEDALRLALSSADTLGIYACMSSQRLSEQKVDKLGRPFRKALRNADNAVELRSLFIDIDVKKGAYASTRDAAFALQGFLKSSGLPNPTIVVLSGSGGFHVHWVLDTCLPRAEWQPLAQALVELCRAKGLFIDAGCTIDAARILRVPQTWNKKHDPPREVRLASAEPQDIPLDDIRAALLPYTKVQIQPSPVSGPDVNDHLSAGLEPQKAPPIGINSLVGVCGIVTDALRDGGANLPGNPMWNLLTLLATFTEEGRDAAHAMAEKNQYYNRQDTDELYDRKLEEKLKKDIGWPRCRAFQAAGATQCASCTLIGNDKSPLNYGAPSAAHPSPVPGAVENLHLPAGYLHDAEGFVIHTSVAADGKMSQTRVANFPILYAWLQSAPFQINVLTLQGNPRQRRQLTFTNEELNRPLEFRAVLGRQGVSLYGKEFDRLLEFIVNWQQVLQTVKDGVVKSAPFGWVTEHGTVEGFSYGGRCWGPNGDKPSATPQLEMQVDYSPTGKLETWKEAAKFVTDQQRQDIAAILAASFAAPLMKWTGADGVVLSAYSGQSAHGKTTTLKIGQAVWGAPKKTQGLNDTSNQVFAKMGVLKHLPVYWDELKSESEIKGFVSMIFKMSSGLEKGRMKSNMEMRKQGEWQTLMMSASNDSILQAVERETRTTTAGVYRVFEFKVQPIAPGSVLRSGQVMRMVEKLNNHYGQAGLIYARFLGENWKQIRKSIAERQDKLIARLQAPPEERFWIAAMTCLLSGAEYANQLELTEFDIEKLLDFLYRVLIESRYNRRESHVDMNNVLAVGDILNRFLQEARAEHMVKTNVIPIGKGKPNRGDVKVLTDVSRVKDLWVHIGCDQKIMRISRTILQEWLARNRFSPTLVFQGLKDMPNTKQINGMLGGGTPFAGSMNQYLLELDLAAPSPFEHYAEHDIVQPATLKVVK